MRSMIRLTTLLMLVLNIVAPAHGQEAGTEVFAPSKSLILEGVPHVPQSLVQRVSPYTAFRTAIFRSWHPSKREMLISTRSGDTLQIHKVEKPGGTPVQLTHFPDRVGKAFYQPKEGNYFVFLKDEDGDDRDQLYRYDLGTKEITQLTRGELPSYGVTWAHSGKWLLYSSARRTSKNSDLYFLDPLNPQSERRLLELPGAYCEVWDVSPDDQKAVVYQYISSEENTLWMVDIPSGKLTRLTPPSEKEKVGYWSAAFSADGKGVYLTSNEGSEFSRLAYLDMATNEMSWVLPELRGDVETITPSPDGKRLAYVVNEEGIGRLRLLDLRSRKEQRVPELPVGVVSNLSWRQFKAQELSFNLETARYPSDVYSFDVQKGSVQRWTKSETGGINTDNLPDAQLIKWKSFDGQEISGFLYSPPAKFKGPRPVLIEIHGGPQVQARPTYGGRYNFFLNELGMAVIFPNVRGSTGFGKTFLSLDNGPKREDCVKDVIALLDHVEAQPRLDARRVMLRGDSYGGYVALSVAAAESGRIKAVMSVSAITSIPSYIKGAHGWVRDLLRIEYGDERDPAQLSFMERLSPHSNVDKITVPLFLAAGKNDVRVAPSLTEYMVRAAQARKLPVWYVFAQDEGHSFNKKVNRDYLFYVSVKFIQQYALGSSGSRPTTRNLSNSVDASPQERHPHNSSNKGHR